MGRHRTVYKRLGNNKVAVLGIPSKAKTNEKRREVVNKTYARHKTNRAIVRRIYDVTTGVECDSAIDLYNPAYTFTTGSCINSTDFNRDSYTAWDETKEGFDYYICKSLADTYGLPRVRDTPPTYRRVSHNPLSGRTRSITNVTNGKLDGRQLEYDSNGDMTSESYYVKGLLHGTKKVWVNKSLVINDVYENGTLTFIGFIDSCYDKSESDVKPDTE